MPREFRSELGALSPKDTCTQARILRLLRGKAPRGLGMNRVRCDLDPGSLGRQNYILYAHSCYNVRRYGLGPDVTTTSGSSRSGSE
jgi:hypothetical protein